MVLNQYTVFLSYDERHDGRLAHSLAGTLQASGMRPLLASQRKEPGTAVDDKVRDMIQESDCVVVFITAHGNKNPWVQQEIGLAKQMDRRIVPLVTGGAKPSGVLSNLIEHFKFKRSDPSNDFRELARILRGYANQAGKPVPEAVAEPDDENWAQLVHLHLSLKCPD